MPEDMTTFDETALSFTCRVRRYSDQLLLVSLILAICPGTSPRDTIAGGFHTDQSTQWRGLIGIILVSVGTSSEKVRVWLGRTLTFKGTSGNRCSITAVADNNATMSLTT